MGVRVEVEQLVDAVDAQIIHEIVVGVGRLPLQIPSDLVVEFLGAIAPGFAWVLGPVNAAGNPASLNATLAQPAIANVGTAVYNDPTLLTASGAPAPTPSTCSDGSITNGTCNVCSDGTSTAYACNTCGDGTTTVNSCSQCTNGSSTAFSCTYCSDGTSTTGSCTYCSDGSTANGFCYSCPNGSTSISESCLY